MKHNTIQVFEAQRDLIKLLERVQAGETFVISSEGQEVAKLIPGDFQPTREALKQVNDLFDRMAEFRKRIKQNHPDAPNIPIREWIEEGRM